MKKFMVNVAMVAFAAAVIAQVFFENQLTDPWKFVTGSICSVAMIYTALWDNKTWLRILAGIAAVGFLYPTCVAFKAIVG